MTDVNATDGPYFGAICNHCRLPFTAFEWSERHSDSDGEDVHEDCCDVCHGDDADHRLHHGLVDPPCRDCERYRAVIQALETELAHHGPAIEHLRFCREWSMTQPYSALATPEDLWWLG